VPNSPDWAGSAVNKCPVFLPQDGFSMASVALISPSVACKHRACQCILAAIFNDLQAAYP
jgi:hypothetical protein